MAIKKNLLIIFIFCCIRLTGFAQEKTFPIPKGNTKQLFYLQRTPNTNTIVYELNFKDGIFDTENPVQSFWLRYQEHGQREELSYIQRKFAYGLKSRKISENNYELNFVSYKKYKMYLRMGNDNKFYVYAKINQHPAILTSIFIKINGGSFWSPNIEYVEISGVEPNSRSIVKERVKI
ncbi:MAG: CDP-alcohol phosphatidyltransferase [Ferruginibacter sp.]|nr:CDP-alcohol phosphatidyltransferase [Ferruginibacter sp.]